jgi:hypothetical protein
MTTPEDYRMIAYFWKEKGDFTRYYRWDDIKDEFRQKHPQFFLAYDQMQLAEKTFNSVLDTLVELEGEDEE